MHNLKRAFPAVLAFFLISAFAAFANGQGEHAKLSGSVASISQPSPNGQVTIVVNGTNGTYSVSVDQSLLAASGLSVGKTITVTGTLHKAPDGTKELNASDVEVDGHQYVVAQTPGSSGTPPTVSEDGSQSSDHGATGAEKPDNSPDHSSSSRDSETPDSSKS